MIVLGVPLDARRVLADLAVGVLSVLQDIPGIPEKVNTESTVAVLFMVVLGLAVLLLLVRSGPALITAWRAATSNGKEAAQISLLMTTLTANVAANERKAAEFALLAGEVRRLSEGLHNRIGPAISGLTHAYYVLAGLTREADELEKKEQDGGFPPARKL